MMPTFLQQATTQASGQARSRDEQGPSFYDQLAAGDPEADRKLKQVISRVRQAGQDGRSILERGWWQKLLYVNGRQWIYPTARGWADKRMAKWIPRPVTNECKLAIQTIRSITTRSVPSLRIVPNGNKTEDVMTAQLAQDLEPIISEEHKKFVRWFEADFWAPTLGTQFFHTYWDRDNNRHQQFVQALECPQCKEMLGGAGFLADPMMVQRGELPECPQCGLPSSDFILAQDENGPIGENQRLGGGVTESVSTLELLIPGYYQRWDDVSEVVRYRWRPKSWYEGRPYEKQIQYSGTSGENLQMFRSLALMTDLTTSMPGAVEGGASNQGCVESELWIQPCDEYPEGLWCRTANGTDGQAFIIRDEERGIVPGPLPYESKLGTRLWPWVYLPYEEIGGRIWAGGALDGVIAIQDKLNRHDSMVELIMQRMANPIWLEPKGAEVQRFTGEPGLIARYNVIAGSTAKPERIEGSGPTSAHFQLRPQYIDDIRRLTGTRDVLQGIQPGGVEAFSALNLLVEQSQGMFTPYLKARGRAQRDLYGLQLELERTYGPDSRVKPILGARNTWTFKMFERKNLTGSVSVIIEDGSESPKTSLGMQAAIERGKGYEIIPFDDPATAQKTLEILGISQLVPSLDAHTKAAKIEQEQYLEWVQTGRPGGPMASPLKVMATQNHSIHVQQLDLWANGDEIRELMIEDETVMEDITLHRVEHLIAQGNLFGMPIPTAAHAAMAQAGGQPPGPGGPGAPGAPVEGAGRALMNSNQESGTPDTLPGQAPGGGNMAAPA
jgi:hypothetical protein